ncbi:MAG: hypothetical protein MUE73_02685 [Planctomycetes bacterium]|jgi:hypothetical protein|nr:hypothetical protein [Planctomycetota bacterium]
MRIGPLLALVLAALPATAADPTPAERILSLRKTWAGKHADLGAFAAGKKLGREALGHYLLAVRLDPECREARARLGHRRSPDGTWSEGRKVEWTTAPEALSKHREDWEKRETAAFHEEASAFEKLGLELTAGGEADPGRPLLLRAAMLDSGREAAVRALRLSPLGLGFVTPEQADALGSVPEAGDGTGRCLGRLLSARTVIRTCGAVTAETPSDPAGTGKLARATHRSQLLTALRFGQPPRTAGWLFACVADSPAQFGAFLDATGVFGEPWLSACKAAGTARAFQPQHFIATVGGGGIAPEACAPTFVHMAAEQVLFEIARENIPLWLSEAASIDACLVICGDPGRPCIPVDESAGLREGQFLPAPATFGPRVLLAALARPRPRLPEILSAPLTAFDVDDLLLAHAVFRHALLTRPAAPGALIAAPGPEAAPAFAAAFGRSAAEIEAEVVSALAGD